MKFIVKRITRKSEKINKFLKELLNDSYIIELGKLISIAPEITSFMLKYSININENNINEINLSNLNKLIKNNEFDLRIFRNIINFHYENGEENYYYKTECELIPYEDYSKIRFL